MTKSLNSQLDAAERDRDAAKREREETEVQLHALRNERFNVEDSYRTLAAKGREEAQLRERHIEGLKREHALFFNKTLFVMVGAGAFGAFLAGLTGEAARWLWAMFLAVVNSGWATLAAWWNS